MTTTPWKDAVTVMRGGDLNEAMRGGGRATVFDFTGAGGKQTWIGTAILEPGGRTGHHHHGRHEVMLYVAAGATQIRWGDALEFSADLAPGDFAYFTPFVPHQEINPSPNEAAHFVVVRSDKERIAIPIEAS